MIILEMKCEVCGELSAFESFEQHYEEDRREFLVTCKSCKRWSARVIMHISEHIVEPQLELFA